MGSLTKPRRDEMGEQNGGNINPAIDLQLKLSRTDFAASIHLSLGFNEKTVTLDELEPS